MEKNLLKQKVVSAAKWSVITEISAKLVSPVTNMILARILIPEEFGVVATITMIVSFVEMFTDSGFQKYLIQQEFENDDILFKYANVAFWTNLLLTIVFFFVILFNRNALANFVGNPGLGNVIIVACLQLPLTAFSSIQTALYKRSFDFKTLFVARLFSILIPFIVTVPLAMAGLSYWALIIGSLLIQVANAVVLTIKSIWKPRFDYSFEKLKKMFSFSVWSLIEALSIWLTTWVDTFIIGSYLSQYYLGVYKTSTSLVNNLLAIIIGATAPVLFATLSRLQDDIEEFKSTFFRFQLINSTLLFPLGVGAFVYRDFLTSIMLGAGWEEATIVIGIWGITRSIKIVFCDPSSEVYRSKGKPRLSFMAQFLHLVVLVPLCLYAVKKGFYHLVYARSLVQLQFVIVHFVLLKIFYKFSIIETIKNVLPTAIASVVMGYFGYRILVFSNNTSVIILSILACIIIYFLILSLFRRTFREVYSTIKTLVAK